MTDDVRPAALDVLTGTWAMEGIFHHDEAGPGGGEARVTFEWMPGHRFLVQTWSTPVPEAPDGIAVIGVDPASDDRFLQHYFDTRGVARVYRMTLEDGRWSLWRDEADFSPLHFRQRYTGTFTSDGRRIDGAWEICHDGTTWELDFPLAYRRLD